MNYLIKISFFIIVLFNFNKVNALENTKIIFKINNKVFTNIDFDRRINYVKILNNLEKNNLDKSDIDKFREDYISALIFYEYNLAKKLIKNNINEELETLYKSLFKNSLTNNSQEITNIKDNLKIDLIRKKIIEGLINSNKNYLNKKTENLDLIYNFNINYLIFKNDNIDRKILENIFKRSHFLKFKNYMDENRLEYMFKNEDINEIARLPEFIKKNIQMNNNIIITEKNGYVTLISVIKNLESYEGIYVKLTNFITKKELESENLNCNFLNSTNSKIEYKEYEYTKLNEEIKKNLKSINDYIMINNDEGFNYIFLCNLRYNEDILNNLNFNKKLNTLAQKIQLNFLKKYKKVYNFQIIE